NFSDHGANRLGASALMQGLADGYFVIPYTLGGYLAGLPLSEAGKVDPEGPAFKEALEAVNERTSRLLSIKGKRSPRSLHQELGKIMWDACGMAREEKVLKAAIEAIPQLREQFWNDVNVVGEGEDLNQELERAGRVADFLEFGELMCRDALDREESCGCHLRAEHQYPDGEAKRDDANFTNVSVWEHMGDGIAPEKTVEPLVYENVHLAVRSYK
ncbi:MAG: fumarate reductase/succinate dehydrogenase flavoprotein subunit, partial [Opitutales bacterium]